MKFDIYYNTDFIACGNHLIRIVFDLGDRGMFVSSHDPKNRTQSFAFKCEPNFNLRYRRRIAGRSANPFVSKTIGGLVFPTHMTNAEYAKAMIACARHLSNSLALFQRKFGSLSPDELSFLQQCISDMTENLCHYRNGEPVTEVPTSDEDRQEAESSSGNGEDSSAKWEIANLAGMDSDDVVNLIQELADKGNPDDGIEWNGERYRLDIGSGGFPNLMIAGDGSPVPPSFRKTVSMAVFRDFSKVSFGSFSKDGFYEIVKNEMVGGKRYLTVLDDLKRECRLNADNLEIVKVYDEPPKAEPPKAEVANA